MISRLCTRLIGAGCALLLNIAHAAPAWTIQALTPSTITMDANQITTVTYLVSNKSKVAHTLTMQAIPGVTPSWSPANCFPLQRNQSCTLTLSLQGSAIAPTGIHGGPILCDKSLCYGPNAKDALNVNIQQSAGSAIILYDNSGPYPTVGANHAILLKNLLGHFNLNTSIKPVSEYLDGEINNQLATFYIGSTYDEPTYYATGSQAYANYHNFLKDVATTQKTVVWMHYNIWQLINNWDTAWGTSFADKFGISGVGIVNNQYNRVTYKDKTLYKGVVPWANPGADLTGCISEGGNTYDCANEIYQMNILDPAKATSYASTFSSINASGTPTPYITKAQNLWYIGDLPFSYISETDRYLALADVLHDMLNIPHAEKHLALIRLEDVSPGSNANNVKTLIDYLESAKTPFSIAAVSEYLDPAGFYNNGVPVTIPMQGSAIAPLLKSCFDKKTCSIVQEGTTHQFGNAANPFTGVSGDDFEFYIVTMNGDNALNNVGPVPGDSPAWAQTRITQGKTVLDGLNFPAYAWFAPHYLASQVDYQAIRDIYPVQYGRITYYSTTMQFLGQYFPYMITQDFYGYTVIPENLGGIEPNPVPGYRVVLPADVINFADIQRVVRDGITSFYYNTDLVPAEGSPFYLQELVPAIQNLGYTFVNACTLVSRC